MALSKLSWDELNSLVGHKISEPYEQYFEPMQISKKQKERRIALARKLEAVFISLLAEIFYCKQLGVRIKPDIYRRAEEMYLAVIASVVKTDEYLITHATNVIADTIAVLKRHEDEAFYYSEDRAMAISEGESNSVWNHTEFEEAVKNKQYKTWNTIMDGRERESHAEVNGVTIPINDLFELRGGYMLYPRSDEYGASEDEIVNCRCSLTFS